ncbi:MAG: phosphate acetyltransferase [Eubacteriales bacterium]
MALKDILIAKAKKDKKRIVLAEGEEIRTITAANKIVKEGIADVVLIGDEKVIREKGKDLSSEVKIIDPKTSDKLDSYAKLFYEIRKSKGVTEEQAKKQAQDPLYFGVLMVKAGEADGMVAGAVHTTSDTIRPALQIIKTRPGIELVSTCFLMEVPKKEFGLNGILVFADCGLNPDPNASELASIAKTSAMTAKELVDMDAKIAMLSFSTKGSAKHAKVEKVAEGVKIAKEKFPELMLDGELQADAALIPKIGESKAPGSKVAGHANVLVFPDLDSGNIGYKLTERLAGATALGPICQGLAKPVNDLSRGCNADDIVFVTAITAVQAQSV